MPPQDPAALKRLETLVQTASTIIKDLSNPSTTTTPATETNNALILARDSATLIRAHVTKLSLLIINEPFTPKAISTILSELLSGGAILGLASAAQSCDPQLYTALFQKELRWRCERTLSELHDFLQKIPRDGKAILKGAQRDGFAGKKGSLPATGLVWAACDNVVALANMGVTGFFVQKMDEWRDTLDDIMQELKEWGDQEPDDEDDEDEDDEDEDDETTSQPDQDQDSSAQDLLDSLMNSHQTIPPSDPNLIRPRLLTSLKNIRLVILLFQATTKRRMKKLPPFPPSTATTVEAPASTTSTITTHAGAVPKRLDEIASLLAKIPDRFGDLAIAFYDLQPGAIDDAMVQCFLDAFAASELLGMNWDGAADEFTQWTEEFRLELKKS